MKIYARKIRASRIGSLHRSNGIGRKLPTSEGTIVLKTEIKAILNGDYEPDHGLGSTRARARNLARFLERHFLEYRGKGVALKTALEEIRQDQPSKIKPQCDIAAMQTAATRMGLRMSRAEIRGAIYTVLHFTDENRDRAHVWVRSDQVPKDRMPLVIDL